MREEYDFSNAIRNPYLADKSMKSAAQQKELASSGVDTGTIPLSDHNEPGRVRIKRERVIGEAQ